MKTALKKNLLLLPLLAICGLAAASDVHLGVTVAGEVSPGVYGRIEIGNRPPPPVVYAQPMVIVQQPAVVHAVPVYLHVPPGHAKKWSKHCHKYDACAQPVYFVKSAEYEPRGHRGRGREDGHGRGHGRGHDDKHGHGHGRDHGKGKGHKD